MIKLIQRGKVALMVFRPFGENECEKEFSLLGSDGYKELFLESRFSESALEHEQFLFIGRRGSGKTALSKYFEFYNPEKAAYVIDVDEPAIFMELFTKEKAYIDLPREIAIPKISKIWEYSVWHLIFEKLKEHDAVIKSACKLTENEPGSFSAFFRKILLSLMGKATNADVVEEIETILNEQAFNLAKERVLAITKQKDLFVVFDTLENYSVDNPQIMYTTAALIHFANRFTGEFSQSGIHLRIFAMAETYPYLKQEVLLNTLKMPRPIYLHWRPKDLLRLICKRFSVYLQEHGHETEEIDWNNYELIKAKIWNKYFGKTIINGAGLEEDTFPYLLRHTQLRPRQLILMCNEIAAISKSEGSFPDFYPQQIIAGVRIAEQELSEEVFNAYSSVYPGASRIAHALEQIPIIFKGSELDKRAPVTASYWEPREAYSQDRFIQFLLELGLVGTVDTHNDSKHYIQGRFEYFLTDRLTILPSTECCVHPMFFRTLNVDPKYRPRVYPFPGSRDLDPDDAKLLGLKQ